MPTTTKDKPRLKALFEDEVNAKVLKEFKLSNTHEAPKLTKMIINCGVGRFLDNQN